MAVLSKEEFLQAIQTRIGEDNSDEALAFVENMTDTYNDISSKTSDDGGWKKKYEELDNSWREKYKSRFFDNGTSADDVKKSQNDDVSDDGEEKTFDDLFTEREG